MIFFTVLCLKDLKNNNDLGRENITVLDDATLLLKFLKLQEKHFQSFIFYISAKRMGEWKLPY